MKIGGVLNCPMVGFGVSGDETSASFTRDLVHLYYVLYSAFKLRCSQISGACCL